MADRFGSGTDTTISHGVVNSGSGFNYQPPKVNKRRLGFLQGRLALPMDVPKGHRILADSPQEQPRQKGPGRGRDIVRRDLIQGKIAASPRPLPLRKRKAKLAAMCRAAGVRNAAGLVAAR